MSIPVGPVVYQVFVNGSQIPDLPLDVSLEQTWGSHDIFTVRIQYNRGYATSTVAVWPDNAPVQIVWGRRPNQLQNWYGYVNHSELSSNDDAGQSTIQYTYVCIGTSKPMNTESSKVWGNVTPTYIAKQMALKYHLRAVLTSTNWMLSNETQANMSDFAYLDYIANKTGFRFWVSGGTLYFTDPAAVLASGSRDGVPAYRIDKITGQQDTARDFRALSGDNLPGSTVANRQIFGIDQTTGHLLQSTSGSTSASVTKVNTSRVATSLGDANRIVGAWQGLSQFWSGATAELFGYSAIYPGKVVYLGGQALPPGNAGYWIIMSARHVLKASWTATATNDKYVTQVVMMRNSQATVPVMSGVNVISPEFVTCSVSNGIWYSNNLTATYDGAN